MTRSDITKPEDTDAEGVFDILLTAAEAFPRFEQAFLDAREEILMGFRVFDPSTELHGDAARAIGRTWFDLIVDALRRGVRITLRLTDFDPVVRPDEHRATWQSLRRLMLAGEVSGRPDLLHVGASMHPARVGILPRVVLWPKTYQELRKIADKMNGMPGTARDKLNDVPGLKRNLALSDGRFRARIWPVPDLVPTTHHQKLAVFDRKLLYIGGLDLDDRRYDTPRHATEASETWRDVQVMTTGSIAQDAAAHILGFEAITKGAEPGASGLLRTLSRRRTWHWARMSPLPVVQEIEQAHKAAIDAAEGLIYLETQFFRDLSLARHIAQAGRDRPGIGVVLILPAAPEEAAFDQKTTSDVRYGEHLQTRCVDIVRDALGDRVFVGSPARPVARNSDGRDTLHGAPIIYVHSKVSIFDDRVGLITSANLNGRSLRWDTEAGVQVHDPAIIARLRDKCMAPLLGDVYRDMPQDAVAQVARWHEIADANARTAPQDRSGLIVPHVVKQGRRSARNLPGVPEEMV